MEMIEMKDEKEKDFVMRLRDHPELRDGCCKEEKSYKMENISK
jgi:hypothetical protein